MGNVLFVALRCVEFYRLVGVSRPPFVRDLHGRVRRIEGDNCEERLVAIRFDKPIGLVREIVRRVAATWDHLIVVIEPEIEVMTPVPRRETIELVESAADRMVGGLGTVMPFPKEPRRVARGAEAVRDRDDFWVQALRALGYPRHADPSMIAAGEKLSSRRSADGLDIEPAEGGPVRRQVIKIRGLDGGVAVQTQVAPPHVVGHDDQDIRVRLVGVSHIRRAAGKQRGH